APTACDEGRKGGEAPLRGSSHIPRMPERVAPGLRPYGEAVRFVADGDGLDLTRGRVDDVDDVVVAAGQPQGLTVGADVAHVVAARVGDRRGGDDRSRGEVDDRHAALPLALLAADAREAAVGHVEPGRVATRVEAVRAHAGLDEADQLERVAVDQVHAARPQI